MSKYHIVELMAKFEEESFPGTKTDAEAKLKEENARHLELSEERRKQNQAQNRERLLRKKTGLKKR